MKNSLSIKKTSLSTTSDVPNCLEWKISSIKEVGLDVEQSLADYIALSIDEVENSLNQLKQLKADIKNRESELKAQKEKILVDGAEYLHSLDIDRLNGNIVSSVTVSKGKEATTTETEVKELVINITEAEVEELLIGLGKAEIVTKMVEKTSNAIPSKEIVTKMVEKTSNAIPSKLKINKRKIIVPEVE